MPEVEVVYAAGLLLVGGLITAVSIYILFSKPRD